MQTSGRQLTSGGSRKILLSSGPHLRNRVRRALAAEYGSARDKYVGTCTGAVEQKRLCKRKRYAQAVSVGVGIYEKVRAHPLLTRFSSDLNVIQADAAVHLDVEERKALAQQPNLHRQPVLHIRGRVSTPGSQAAIPYRARSSAREVDRCKHRSRTMHWTEPLVRLALALAPPPFVVPSPTFGIISGMNF